MATHSRFDDSTRAKLMAVSVPTVVSTLWRRGLKNTLMVGPQPVNPGVVKFVGPAVTVRTIAVREDLLEEQTRGDRPNLQSEAVAKVGAGEVLVIDMGGETRTAFMGDVMSTHMQVKGVAGVVLDGSVSDAAAIAEIPLPVFCAGNAATPLTSHRMVIEINGPIDCGGVPIYAGDIVMGDGNGIAVIPAHLADEIAETCAEREILEEFVVEKVRAGAPLKGTYPPDEATLAEFRDWRAERGR